MRKQPNKKFLQRGVTLYLAIVITIVILGIGLGISTILVSQLKTFRGIGSSLQSFYAADTGIEVMLGVQDCIDDNPVNIPGPPDEVALRLACIRRMIEDVSPFMPGGSCSGNLSAPNSRINCLIRAIDCHEEFPSPNPNCDVRNRIGGPTEPHYTVCRNSPSSCSIVAGGTILSCPAGADYCAESTGDWPERNDTNRRIHFIGDFDGL